VPSPSSSFEHCTLTPCPCRDELVVTAADVLLFFALEPALMPTVAYGCIVFAVGLSLATVPGILLHCRPVKYNWTLPLEDSRYCFNLKPFVIAIAGVGVALDALIWTLPHRVIWRLQLRISHKVAITVIFAFGLLCNDSHTADMYTLLTVYQQHRYWRSAYKRAYRSII
jgi:hypothetical protein